MKDYPLKIVLGLKGDKGSVGLQAEDTDPLFFHLEEGTLEAALPRIPELVQEARRRWDTSPRHPKHEGPPAPPSPAPRSQPVSQPRVPEKPKVQPGMF